MGWSFGRAFKAAFKIGGAGGLPGLVLVGPLAFVVGGFCTDEQIDAVYTGSETAHDYIHGVYNDNL